MHGRTGVATGRTELLVVLLISVAGVAVAAIAALTPWHPTVSGRHPDTSTIVKLSPPKHRTHPSDRVPVDHR